MDDLCISHIVRIVLKKRWIPIILIGVLCAGSLVAWKNNFSTFTVVDGDFIVSSIIESGNYQDKKDFLKYNEYLTSTTNIMSFYNQTKTQINYEKLCLGWQSKSDFQKEDWLKKHLKVFYFGDGKIELGLRIMASEPKNIRYLEDNGSSVIDAWVKYINSIESNNQFSIEKTYISMPKEVPVEKNKILMKYGVIGFFLGLILGFLIFLLQGIKKSYGREC